MNKITLFFIILLFTSCTTHIFEVKTKIKKEYKIGDEISLKSNKLKEFNIQFKYKNKLYNNLKYKFNSLDPFVYSIIVFDEDKKIVFEDKNTIIPKDREALYYIPKNSEIVVKNDKNIAKLFSIEIKENSIFTFIKDSKKVTIFKEKIANSKKINSYYFDNLEFDYNYKFGEFNKRFNNYNLYLYGNYINIISNKENKLKILSTKKSINKRDKKLLISLFNNKEVDFMIYENSPVFFDYFSKVIKTDYKFSSLKSYFFVKYKDKIKKKYFSKIEEKEKSILIITLRDWSKIMDFKHELEKSFNTQFLYSSKFYSDKKEEIFIFFKGDMIIVSKNLDPIKMLKKLKKIPFTSPKENKRNFGFILTDNHKKFKNLFRIFEFLEFSGKVEYYFYDLDI